MACSMGANGLHEKSSLHHSRRRDCNPAGRWRQFSIARSWRKMYISDSASDIAGVMGSGSVVVTARSANAAGTGRVATCDKHYAGTNFVCLIGHYVHTSRRSSPYRVPLRPFGVVGTAPDPPAACTTCAHAGAQVLAFGAAGQALSELAARPVRQLCRPSRLRREGASAGDHRGSGGRNRHHQSVRFFCRKVCGSLSVSVRRAAA